MSSTLTAVRRTYIDGRYGQIHLRITQPTVATRTPLLCFHMSPHSGRVFENFLAAIGTDRVAVAPDTPGFGESDPPREPPKIEDYAAAMGDVIDALGLSSIDVMGYHTGSETAVALALLRPMQVRRVVMVSAPIFTPEELVAFRSHYGADTITADGSHLVKKWQGHLRWAGGRSKEMVAESFADALRNPSISWWGHRAAFEYDLASNLPRVTQPILVLNPDDDLCVQTMRAQGQMQRGRILDLPRGWGHGFLDLHTAAAREIVTTFLDEK